VLDLCRLTAPLLLAAPAASVINVASMYGIVASRGPMAAYNATKGALVNLTGQLAAQWGSGEYESTRWPPATSRPS
jgi:NAD(P)-dependent dehydrogenase (short-subunit alcohol dehydrogenase family)